MNFRFRLLVPVGRHFECLLYSKMNFLLVNDLTFGLISIENEKSKKVNDYAFMRMLCNVCCDEGGTANDDNEGLIQLVVFHQFFLTQTLIHSLTL